MDASLPLPLDALPAAIRRFADPSAPGPARVMAARGVVPGLKGEDLVTLLVQLSADADAAVASTAQGSLLKLPDALLLAACEAALLGAVLDGLARAARERDDVLERVVANAATPDATVERVARTCSERVSERIAVNEARVLRAPEIIEALYHNPATRMSTADRLVDLAARNGLELAGIPMFKAHVEALQGQLIAEPTEEPLPDDSLYREALAEDRDEAAVDHDADEDVEEINEKFIPLHKKIADMTVPQKIRFATIGSSAARELLVRDPMKVVAVAAIASPRMTAADAAKIAKSKEVADDVLRYIGRRKEWVQQYEVKRALVFNPKTPVATALSWIGHLRDADLKLLSRSRGVPAPIKTAAAQRLTRKERG